jgi:hypothetical protein
MHMRIKTIFSNCLLLIATTGFAQNHRQLSYGVRGGLNISTSEGSQRGTSGLLGVYLQTNSLKHSFLHFQLEALYKVITINHAVGDSPSHTQNVELPLSIRLAPKKQFFVFGGVAPSLSMSSNDVLGKFNQGKSPIKLTYFAGVGSTFYEGFGLDFRICSDYNGYRSCNRSYCSVGTYKVTTFDMALTYTLK